MNASFLMCRPDHYGIDYEINPWMDLAVQPDKEKALVQWKRLVSILKEEFNCTIKLVPPVKGLPDMVFTANAGYVQGKRFIPSRFRFAERRGEERHFRKWFEDEGYEIAGLPESASFFEGFGDALPLGDTLFAGYRYRSDIASHKAIGKILGRRIISLELVNPAFYHLDTCFCPLPSGDLLYYPGAFDEYGLKVIREVVDKGRLIEIKREEAERFSCNAVVLGEAIVMNSGSSELKRKLEERGYTILETDLSEFIKSGGSAKCLTLRLGYVKALKHIAI